MPAEPAACHLRCVCSLCPGRERSDQVRGAAALSGGLPQCLPQDPRNQGGQRSQQAQQAQCAQQRFLHCSECSASAPSFGLSPLLTPALCAPPPRPPAPLPPQFNSTNKWQLSIHRPESASAQHPILVLKGAPERVLRMCTHIMVDGESVPMDAGWQNKYNEGGCCWGGGGGWGALAVGFPGLPDEGEGVSSAFCFFCHARHISFVLRRAVPCLLRSLRDAGRHG